jgi:hypothetical protein
MMTTFNDFFSCSLIACFVLFCAGCEAGQSVCDQVCIDGLEDDFVYERSGYLVLKQSVVLRSDSTAARERSESKLVSKARQILLTYEAKVEYLCGGIDDDDERCFGHFKGSIKRMVVLDVSFDGHNVSVVVIVDRKNIAITTRV